MISSKVRRPDRPRGPAARSSFAPVAAVALAAAFAAAPAFSAEYALAPGQKAVGEIAQYTVKHGDVLADIARRFDLGYTELAAANPGVDPWVPRPGTVLTIPSLHVLPDAPHQGIVINLAQSRLYYFPGGDRVDTYPITIGFIGKNTPLGTTRVVNKEANPSWYPPASIRREEPELPAAVPPGPDNPLGAFALKLGWANYLIHGTNKPDSIGRTVSHGCIRLYPEDIDRLFHAVGVGTTVRTVQQPATAGWKDDGLYVQVSPSKEQAEAIDTEQPAPRDPARGVEALVTAAAAANADGVNWGLVDRAADQRSGVAVKVADRSGAYIASSEPSIRQETPPDLPAFDPAHETRVSRPGPSRNYDRTYEESAYAGQVYEAPSYATPSYAPPYEAPVRRGAYVRAPSEDEGGNNPLYGVLPYGAARYRGPAYPDAAASQAYSDPGFDTPAYGPPGYDGSDPPAAGPQKLYSNWYTGR